MSEERPIRIVVEVVSHADVARLEARDEEIRQEIAAVSRKMEGLHRTFYEFLQELADKRKNR